MLSSLFCFFCFEIEPPFRDQFRIRESATINLEPKQSIYVYIYIYLVYKLSVYFVNIK